jgi:DMSO/TMAO reductase YedYZ molybdopterin-dependent catalytic subunit
MKRALWLTLGAVLLATAPGHSEPPPTAANAPKLSVGGEVSRPLKLTLADLAALPRQSVRAQDHSGKESLFEGVALGDVLRQAGVKLGQDLRGPAMAHYLVVEASDGYRAVFALPELDSVWTDRVILLVDRRDGQPLGANEGRLRVVVPGEKRHGRWVRQVIALKVGKA